LCSWQVKELAEKPSEDNVDTPLHVVVDLTNRVNLTGDGLNAVFRYLGDKPVDEFLAARGAFLSAIAPHVKKWTLVEGTLTIEKADEVEERGSSEKGAEQVVEESNTLETNTEVDDSEYEETDAEVDKSDHAYENNTGDSDSASEEVDYEMSQDVRKLSFSP
jgi:hypothetical protein